NRRPVLRLHDEDVAPVALGDDLILQVLRRLLAAQVRLERPAQQRRLLPQPIADHFQLGARIVDDLAGLVDLLADAGGFVLERRGAAAGGFEVRKRSRAANRGDGVVDRREERRQLQETRRFERAALDRERRERLRQIGG